MNSHECRLQAMLDEPSIWQFSKEDCDAVAWALDALKRLEAERDEIRDIYAKESHESWKKRQAIKAKADDLSALCG